MDRSQACAKNRVGKIRAINYLLLITNHIHYLFHGNFQGHNLFSEFPIFSYYFRNMENRLSGLFIRNIVWKCVTQLFEYFRNVDTLIEI